MSNVCPNFCHFPEEKISVSILGTCKLTPVYIYNARCVFIEMNDKDRQEKSISAGIVLYLWFQKLDKFLKISISPSRYLTFWSLLGFDENHKLLHIVRSSSLSTKDDKKLKLILNIYLSEWSTNRVSKSWHSLTFSVKYRFVLMCEPPYTLHILRCSTESRSEIRDRSGQ